MGTHIFDAAGSPTFDLGSMGELVGKKAVGGDMVAPVAASFSDGRGGGNGVGGGSGRAKSVNWLKLEDKGGSWGVGAAYRVDTVAGVVGDACQGKQGGEEVDRRYAALYYFYG